MKPLHVVAHLSGPVVMPTHPVALDALLASAVAVRDGVPPAYCEGELVPLDIPVAKEPGGRFHLASCASYEVEAREGRHLNRRPVVEEAQWLGDLRRKRMQISAGKDKGYRIPITALHLVEDRMDWWAVGDAVAVRDLLDIVTHVGKKRSVGVGRVDRWVVEQCEPWGDGFPVVTPDGRPTRALPVSWPGIQSDSTRVYAPVTYPYWLMSRAEECYAPCL